MSAASHDETLREENPFSFLKTFAEASAVFVGLTFFAGWSYLASYYKTFGLNPMDVDVPVPVAATIALHMLYDSVWPMIALVVVVAALAVAAHRFGGRQVNRHGLMVAGLVLVMFFAATAALIRGRQVANRDMLEESSSLPLVAFSSKSEAAKIGPPVQPSCIGFQTLGGMDCKLLLHSKGVYYFFRPIPKSLRNKTDKLDMYVIPDSEVLGLHIQRGIDLSGVEE